MRGLPARRTLIWTKRERRKLTFAIDGAHHDRYCDAAG
jgi:hypothetical protein